MTITIIKIDLNNDLFVYSPLRVYTYYQIKSTLSSDAACYWDGKCGTQINEIQANDCSNNSSFSDPHLHYYTIIRCTYLVSSRSSDGPWSRWDWRRWRCMPHSDTRQARPRSPSRWRYAVESSPLPPPWNHSDQQWHYSFLLNKITRPCQKKNSFPGSRNSLMQTLTQSSSIIYKLMNYIQYPW